MDMFGASSQNPQKLILDQLAWSNNFTRKTFEKEFGDSDEETPTGALKPTVTNRSVPGKPGNLSIVGDPKVVLQKLTPHLCATLTKKNTNTLLIQHIAALNFFDPQDVNEVLHGEFLSEYPRINKWLGQIASLEDDEIKECLQQLCKVPYQPITTKHIKKLFETNCADFISFV